MNYIHKQALNPDWEEFSQIPFYVARPHEWKNYISKELQAIWDTFTDEQKQILADNADEIASREEWD